MEMPTDWSIQYVLRHDQPMLLQVPRGPCQAVFVMHRFDDISQLILSFRVNISARCLTVAMDRVILVQAVKLTFGAVLKWTFMKLPASNASHNGCTHNQRLPGHRSSKCY